MAREDQKPEITEKGIFVLDKQFSCDIIPHVRLKGHGVMVTRGSPKPLLRVRILLPLHTKSLRFVRRLFVYLMEDSNGPVVKTARWAARAGPAFPQTRRILLPLHTKSLRLVRRLFVYVPVSQRPPHWRRFCCTIRK